MSDAAPSSHPNGPYPQPTYPPVGFPPAADGGARRHGPLATAVGRFWGVRSEGSVGRWPLVAALACGALAAVMVVGHEPGLGLALSALAVWLPALPTLVRRRAWQPLLTAGLGIALAAMMAVRAADWVMVLCLTAALGVCAVAATQARSVLGIGLAVPTMPLAVLRAAQGIWSEGSGQLRGRRAETVRWLRTAVVTGVLLVVFIALLSSADAVFASLIPDVDLGMLPAQVVVGIAAASLALAVVGLAARRPAWSVLRLPRPPAARRLEWFVPVLAVAAVMVAFLLTQVVSAVGGDAYVQRTAGLTYAAYARQGFGQLVAVTALTLAVVAWFARRAPRQTPRDRWSTRAALGLLCVSALGVVATALLRMALYVQAYGLTELRLLATTGEVVMGVVLVLVLVAGVRWRARWLPVAAVRIAGAAVLALALANPDALMVTFNSQAQDAPVDVAHLSGLSADAVPAIDALDEPLRTCLLGWQDTELGDSVWEWNLARSRAAAIDDVAVPDC